MATRKKAAEGIELLQSKQDPISIQEITMLDWYASFALLGASPMSTNKETVKAAFDLAEEALRERAKRID
jgi:spermidine/putrescine-binding protein